MIFRNISVISSLVLSVVCNFADRIEGVEIPMSDNKPKFTLRDGTIKLVCWENVAEGGNVFHSVEVIRSYKPENSDWKETPQLSGTDLLKAASLLQEAYLKIREFRQARLPIAES